MARRRSIPRGALTGVATVARGAAVVVLGVAVGAAGVAGATPQAVDTAAAVSALAEFDDACSRAESLWPAELCGPVVLVHPATRTAVANRPDPGGTFDARDEAFVGLWPDHLPVANTNLQWEGEMWAMVMLPLPDDTYSRLQLLAHESFHRIQGELGHEISDPMAVHLDEEEGRVWLRLELRALASALASDREDARTAALDALRFRAVRHRAFPGAADVERRLEAHEGLAEYTGARFALDVTGAGADEAARRTARFETRPTYVRSLGYGTGPALGLLLDRYRPGWRDELGPDRDLAGLLAEALDAPAPASDARGAAERRAAAYGYEAVRIEESERAAEMEARRARYRAELVEGPVLVLELPERRVMFNPNTVFSLGADGNVYPGAILLGPWGRLTLQEGAALLTDERDRARVRAPGVDEAGPGGAVEGPGWILELEPGWSLVPGGRRGDVRLERAGPGSQ